MNGGGSNSTPTAWQVAAATTNFTPPMPVSAGASTIRVMVARYLGVPSPRRRSVYRAPASASATSRYRLSPRLVRTVDLAPPVKHIIGNGNMVALGRVRLNGDLCPVGTPPTICLSPNEPSATRS